MEKHSEPLRLYLMKFVVRDSQFVVIGTTTGLNYRTRGTVQKHPLNQMVWFRMLGNLYWIGKFISYSSHGLLYGFGLFLLI